MLLEALTLHEAVPGHHLQISLNAELESAYLAIAVDAYLSAFGEGWGLYSEYLGVSRLVFIKTHIATLVV